MRSRWLRHDKDRRGPSTTSKGRPRWSCHFARLMSWPIYDVVVVVTIVVVVVVIVAAAADSVCVFELQCCNKYLHLSI